MPFRLPKICESWCWNSLQGRCEHERHKNTPILLAQILWDCQVTSERPERAHSYSHIVPIQSDWYHSACWSHLNQIGGAAEVWNIGDVLEMERWNIELGPDLLRCESVVPLARPIRQIHLVSMGNYFTEIAQSYWWQKGPIRAGTDNGSPLAHFGLHGLSELWLQFLLPLTHKSQVRAKLGRCWSKSC